MTPQRETRAYLWDVIEACDAVAEYIAGADLARYSSERQLRASVEREVFIMGEAVNSIRKQEPLAVHVLGDVAGIIEVRNILGHAYFIVKHDRMWDVATKHVPRLRAAAKEWLDTFHQESRP